MIPNHLVNLLVILSNHLVNLLVISSQSPGDFFESPGESSPGESPGDFLKSPGESPGELAGFVRRITW